jgi:peroxiredoxin/outer membrane lipoprotein-sorting protein
MLLVVVLAQVGVSFAEEATRVSPEAKALLDKVSQAYSNLQSAQLDGTISARLPAVENPEQTSSPFASAFQAPNKFRHDMQGKLIVGSTGQKGYVYQPSAKAYVQGNMPEGKPNIDQLPAPIPQLLQAQNPSLLFALVQNPISMLTSNMTEVATGEPVMLNGGRYLPLRLSPREGKEKITWLIDPQTYLIKRFTVEIPPEQLQALGVTNALQGPAVSEIDYSTINVGVKYPADRFAWTPPEGARDMGAALQKEATNLVGRAAPNFTLKDLQGKETALGNLKGQVVVLDFWATWCQPCVRSLPELEKFQKQVAGKDVQIFAVNLQEDRAKVEAFLKAHQLNLPVLLDPEGSMADKYHITAIPETVVIGKDGVVKNIFIGNTSQSTQELRDAVNAALQEYPTATGRK